MFIACRRINCFTTIPLWKAASRNTSFKRLASVHANQDENKKADQEKYKEEMKSWFGSSRSTSEFVTHFISSKNNITVEDAIKSVLPAEFDEDIERTQQSLKDDSDELLSKVDMMFRHDPSNFPLGRSSPADLLAIGSIWYLPATAPRDPALGLKPVRLEVKNLTSTLNEGDYLRVHHEPRRFPRVSEFDWSASIDDEVSEDGKRGVIIAENEGYIIISKPAGVPVHSTVDNCIENVPAAIGRAIIKQKRTEVIEKAGNNTKIYNKMEQRQGQKTKKEDPLIYVVPPQRLDQNTSGIFVVATKKSFAAYFAKMLRTKTDAHLNTEVTGVAKAKLGQIQKRYRCLLCVQPQMAVLEGEKPTSVLDEIKKLRYFEETQETVRHFLKPDKRAPKVYSQVPNEGWLECLMKIAKVGEVIPVNDELAEALWGDKDMKPNECKALVEVEVELMTGRAHQIRGQLSELGFPLCGDAMYGGAILTTEQIQKTIPSLRKGHTDGYLDSEQLALQCCELQFLDPDYTINAKGKEIATRSKRVNKFRLENSWWTTFLDKYKDSNPATTSEADLKDASTMQSSEALENKSRVSVQEGKCKIEKVQLSAGPNKYVIIKASSPTLEKPEWYVKSASPAECGGPYHADVARELVRELNENGYDTIVCGGGRITYDPIKRHAHVYGFSYGFGKGEHDFVALLIEEAGFSASFDDSDTLY